VASFVSPSGHGVKILYDVRGATRATHRSACRAAQAHAAALCGLAANVDEKTHDPTRLTYVSHDPGMSVKWDTTPLPFAAVEEEVLHRPRRDVERVEAEETTPYGRSRLAEAAAVVAAAGKGRRHHTIVREAFIIGGLVASGHIVEAEARSALQQAADECGLGAGESDRAIDDGFADACPWSPESLDEEDDLPGEDLAEVVVRGRTEEAEVAPARSLALNHAGVPAQAAGADESQDEAKPERFWRKITDQQVEEIVNRSPLRPIADALRAVADPPLPFRSVILKALGLAASCLAGPRQPYDYDPDKARDYDWKDETKVGSALARVRIMTADGQVPNIWGLLVGDSSAGKDIGKMVGKMIRAKGLWLGGAGSPEGFAEAMTKCPNGLVEIGEFKNWICKDDKQSDAREFFTSMWSDGSFRKNLAGRERSAPYAYPSPPDRLLQSVEETAFRRGWRRWHP
jgi:hypothetical protein